MSFLKGSTNLNRSRFLFEKIFFIRVLLIFVLKYNKSVVFTVLAKTKSKKPNANIQGLFFLKSD